MEQPITLVEGEKKVIKGPCCVCKDTRADRDMCLITRNEQDCQGLVETHNQCLRSFGFHPEVKQ